MTEKFIKPMEPVLVARPFDDPRFLYQIKWDGIRIIKPPFATRPCLKDKNGHFRTDRYPSCGAQAMFYRGKRDFRRRSLSLDQRGSPVFTGFCSATGKKANAGVDADKSGRLCGF